MTDKNPSESIYELNYFIENELPHHKKRLEKILELVIEDNKNLKSENNTLREIIDFTDKGIKDKDIMLNEAWVQLNRVKALSKKWRIKAAKGNHPTDREIGWEQCADELEEVLK